MSLNKERSERLQHWNCCPPSGVSTPTSLTLPVSPRGQISPEKSVATCCAPTSSSHRKVAPLTAIPRACSKSSAVRRSRNWSKAGLMRPLVPSRSCADCTRHSLATRTRINRRISRVRRPPGRQDAAASATTGSTHIGRFSRLPRTRFPPTKASGASCANCRRNWCAVHVLKTHG